MYVQHVSEKPYLTPTLKYILTCPEDLVRNLKLVWLNKVKIRRELNENPITDEGGQNASSWQT